MQHDDSPDRAQPICWFCGEPEKLEIGDLWTDSNFVLDACCSGLLDSVAEGMNDDPAWGRELLRRLGAEEITGHRLRRVSDGDCCHPMLDWQLTIRPIRFAEAQAFINRHHAHCRAPVGWISGNSVWNGGQMLGVATLSNSVARALNGRGIAEMARLCIRRDVAPLLRWNAASMLLGAGARSAEQAGFERVITYTLQNESGTSLRAAGWVQESVVRGRGWNRAGRPRSNVNAYAPKIRWSRTLRPRIKKPARAPRAEPAVAADWMRLDDADPLQPFAIPTA